MSSVKSLESVVKLTSDTSEFETGMKRAMDATKLLEKQMKATFKDPILQAGMQLMSMAADQMAAQTERAIRNANEYSPIVLRERALADAATLRADVTEGNAAAPMAAQQARDDRIRAMQRESNIKNPTWASDPNSFFADPFGWIGRKYDAFNTATDIAAQQYEQQTGFPGIGVAFASKGMGHIMDLMHWIETGNGGVNGNPPVPPSDFHDPFSSMGRDHNTWFFFSRMLGFGGG